MLWKLLSSGGKNPTIINMKTSTSVDPRAPLTILTGHPRDKQRAVSLQELSRSLPLGTGPLALIHLSSFTQDTQNLPSPLPKLTMMVWKSQSISTVLLLWRRSCMRLDIKKVELFDSEEEYDKISEQSNLWSLNFCQKSEPFLAPGWPVCCVASKTNIMLTRWCAVSFAGLQLKCPKQQQQTNKEPAVSR